MKTLLFITAVMVVLGLVWSLAKISKNDERPLLPLLVSGLLLFIEASVVGIVKLAPWVWAWSAETVTKASFLLMVINFSLGVILFSLSKMVINWSDSYKIAFDASLLMLTISAVTCGVTAIISEVFWQVMLSVIICLTIFLLAVFNEPHRRWARERHRHPGEHYFMGEWHRNLTDL